MNHAANQTVRVKEEDPSSAAAIAAAGAEVTAREQQDREEQDAAEDVGGERQKPRLVADDVWAATGGGDQGPVILK